MIALLTQPVVSITCMAVTSAKTTTSKGKGVQMNKQIGRQSDVGYRGTPPAGAVMAPGTTTDAERLLRKYEQWCEGNFPRGSRSALPATELPSHLRRLHNYKLPSGDFSAQQVVHQPECCEPLSLPLGKIALARPHLLEFIDGADAHRTALSDLAGDNAVALNFYRDEPTDDRITVQPVVHQRSLKRDEATIVVPNLSGALIQRIHHLVSPERPTVTALLVACLPTQAEPLIGAPYSLPLGINVYGRVELNGTTSTLVTIFARSKPTGSNCLATLSAGTRTEIGRYIDRCIASESGMGSWGREVLLPR